jgi:hypothetical protein
MATIVKKFTATSTFSDGGEITEFSSADFAKFSAADFALITTAQASTLTSDYLAVLKALS